MRWIITTLLLLLLAGDVRAADLRLGTSPLKAPPPLPSGCTVVSCTGFFLGANIASAGGNLDVIGTGLTGLADNGFAIGGQAGYEYFANKIYAAIIANLDYDMALNGGVPGAAPVSFNSKLTYGIGVRLGYSLSGLFGGGTTTPIGLGSTGISLPQELLSSLMTPYVNMAEVKRHGQPALVSGAGVEALLTADATGHSSWTLNADYLHYTYNQGGSAGTIGGGVLPAMTTKLTSDNEIRVSLNRHFF